MAPTRKVNPIGRGVLLAGALALGLPLVTAHPCFSFTNGQAASSVLGQPDFTTPDLRPASQNSLNMPEGVWYDGANNRLFVGDLINSRVMIFDVSTLSNNQNAIHELGQAGYTTLFATQTQNGMANPIAGLFDPLTNRLFVSDNSNGRVLVFNNANNITDGMNASSVLGQPDFTTVIASPPDAKTMVRPAGLAYDAARHHLFECDWYNNRVLVFDVSPITNYQNAIAVLGQPDFTSNAATLSQSGMFSPTGVAYDPNHNHLFVADNNNSRVLVYDVSTLTNGQNAIAVLGEPDFNTNLTANFGNNLTQTGLSGPYSLDFDPATNRLFVGDSQNVRIMIFDVSTVTNFQKAINVLGWPDFTTANFHSVNATETFHTFGLAYDSIHRRLFTADYASNRVLVFFDSPAGPVITPARPKNLRVQ